MLHGEKIWKIGNSKELEIMQDKKSQEGFSSFSGPISRDPTCNSSCIDKFVFYNDNKQVRSAYHSRLIQISSHHLPDIYYLEQFKVGSQTDICPTRCYKNYSPSMIISFVDPKCLFFKKSYSQLQFQ